MILLYFSFLISLGLPRNSPGFSTGFRSDGGSGKPNGRKMSVIRESVQYSTVYRQHVLKLGWPYNLHTGFKISSFTVNKYCILWQKVFVNLQRERIYISMDRWSEKRIAVNCDAGKRGLSVFMLSAPKQSMLKHWLQVRHTGVRYSERRRLPENMVFVCSSTLALTPATVYLTQRFLNCFQTIRPFASLAFELVLMLFPPLPFSFTSPNVPLPSASSHPSFILK